MIRGKEMPKQPAKEPETPETTEPEKPAELDSIKQAREERTKMDETVAAMKKENDRAEKMHADNIIAGKAVNQGDPVEESASDYTKKVMGGNK